MIETPRLILRPWRDADREPFAALNADPEVMAYFPKPLDRAESDGRVDRIMTRWDQHGFCFAAIEVKDQGFVGFTGLSRPFWPPHLADSVEIGWRLARPAWGRGYATEAARAWLGYGFGTLALDQIVAFAVAANARSRAVMARLGMAHDPAADFEDDARPTGSPLRPLALYRINRREWEAPA